MRIGSLYQNALLSLLQRMLVPSDEGNKLHFAVLSCLVNNILCRACSVHGPMWEWRPSMLLLGKANVQYSAPVSDFVLSIYTLRSSRHTNRLGVNLSTCIDILYTFGVHWIVLREVSLPRNRWLFHVHLVTHTIATDS